MLARWTEEEEGTATEYKWLGLQIESGAVMVHDGSNRASFPKSSYYTRGRKLDMAGLQPRDPKGVQEGKIRNGPVTIDFESVGGELTFFPLLLSSSDRGGGTLDMSHVGEADALCSRSGGVCGGGGNGGGRDGGGNEGEESLGCVDGRFFF